MERFNTDLYLTTSQVADLLEVHPSTVKRWCNEGELSFDKTDGGHRRIHLRDVLALTEARGLQTLLSPFAPYEGHVWTALNEAESGSFERVISLALGWLDRGHIDRMGSLFLELGRHPRIAFESFCDDCIRGLMVQVGELWRTGQLRAGEEHMVTEMLVETLLRLRDEGSPTGVQAGPDSPAAVVGAMEGDRHHLASLCLRIILERRGWNVFYLGADVPVEDFAAIQSARSASLVCVSFAPPNTGADMQRCVRILSEFYTPGKGWSLALGGEVGSHPELDPLALPFTDFRIFDSMGEFSPALDAGFGKAPFTSAASA